MFDKLSFTSVLVSQQSTTIKVRKVAWWNGFEVLKATIFVITFVWICRTLHVGVWSQRPGGKGQEPALCEGLVEVQQLSFEQWGQMIWSETPWPWRLRHYWMTFVNWRFSLGQNQGEAGTPTGGSHHSRLVINRIANHNYKTKQLSQLTGKRDWSTGILSSQLLSHRILTENWCNNWSGQFLRNV